MIWIWIGGGGGASVCLWIRGVDTHPHPLWTHPPWSTSGRYASYWNAFWFFMWIFDALLFGICLPFQCFTEVVCSIPLEYPEVLPSVFVRCQFMSRISQKEFNECLLNCMRTLEEGDLCMSSVLMWIQENAEEWIDENKKDEDASTSSFTKTKCKYSGLSKLWIYSHHIYRKELLKKIPESAKELDLTGFCLPGKPGIICAEGYKENCDEYWQRLKYPNWKHISCKHREDLPLQEFDIEDHASAQFWAFQ